MIHVGLCVCVTVQVVQVKILISLSSKDPLIKHKDPFVRPLLLGEESQVACSGFSALSHGENGEISVTPTMF